jgi:hypothetical protein
MNLYCCTTLLVPKKGSSFHRLKVVAPLPTATCRLAAMSMPWPFVNAIAIVVVIAIVVSNVIGIAAYRAARVCDYTLFLNNRTSSAAHDTSV